MDDSMKLVCSRGCEFDTAKQPMARHLRPGDRCPSVIAYSRMDHSKCCRRVLYPAYGEPPALMVIANDRTTAYGTNDQIHHYIWSDKRSVTLCGIGTRFWAMFPSMEIGSATLCARCEAIAKKRGYIQEDI